MANASIKAAFERMWQHVVNILGTKVSFTEVQELTDDQKAQARENIGVQQPDWEQTDSAAYGFIKNKPDEDDALLVAIETELIEFVASASGEILTDKNGTIITL